MSHTPGPLYRPEFPHDTEVYVTETERDEDLEMIAEFGPAMRDDEALANACLFEVAPQLLEAAKAVLKNYGYFRRGMEWGLPDEHPLTALRAAILTYEDGLKRGREVTEQARAERYTGAPR